MAVPDVSAELDDDATAVMMRPDLDQLQRSKPLPAAGRPAAPSPGAPATGAPAAGAPAAGASAPGAPAAGASAAEAEVEWWIGIEGEPVGPIEVDYVRRQLASGKATPTSLVWREEMTDWQPLNTVDELWSSLSDVAGTKAPAAEVSDPLALERLKDTDAAGSSGPGVSKPEPPAAAAAPAKAPAESPEVAAAPAEPVRQLHRLDESTEDQPVSEPAPSSEQLAALAGLPRNRRKKRRGVSPMAYAFIAMATAFGAVSAWFVFGTKNETTPSPVADIRGPEPAKVGDKEPVDRPSPGPGETAQPDGSAQAAGSAVANNTQAGKTGFQPGNSGKHADDDDGGGKPPPKKPAEPCSPEDPFCGSGPDGPSAGTSGEGSGESGQGLTQAQLNAAVSRHKGSLMRRCRSMVTKGGAKVFATITVGSSGAVQSVSASGGKDYPGLASCVSSRIRNWSFPPSGGKTTVAVSFNFL